MSASYVRTVKKDDGRIYHYFRGPGSKAECPQARFFRGRGMTGMAGSGWLTTGRPADTSGGSGFHPRVYVPERIRCPARCDAGALVRATDIGDRAGGEVPR